VVFTNRTTGESQTINDMQLPMHGLHNVQNSLAAIAIAHELGISFEMMRSALSGFSGVKRRFTKTGEAGGITVIDDYGHHPVEIAAVLAAAKTARGENGRTIAVMQPHRYTRLSDLFNEFCTCFNDADIVIITDVYAAGEQPIDGANKDALAQGLKNHGHRNVHTLKSPEELPAMIHDLALSGDMVVCLGAGTITSWAQTLPEQLETLQSQHNKKAAS
jgi:UDP-N-acetylmuramate--alanine ligase